MVELNKLLKDVGEGAVASGVSKRRCRSSWQEQELTTRRHRMWVVPVFCSYILLLPPVPLPPAPDPCG